jgi:hypothetical protein
MLAIALELILTGKIVTGKSSRNRALQTCRFRRDILQHASEKEMTLESITPATTSRGRAADRSGSSLSRPLIL